MPPEIARLAIPVGFETFRKLARLHAREWSLHSVDDDATPRALWTPHAPSRARHTDGNSLPRLPPIIQLFHNQARRPTVCHSMTMPPQNLNLPSVIVCLAP